ncbi:unnamed protein product [Paramecium sonneborni]|uniref:Phospholipid-transporting ATPase n=1 Tax=Paramecium sonneborni TaxID=65129 RepID=A0A8S1QK66_9CILI|nr:unnamed protein product [Paramecium sonneborni]
MEFELTGTNHKTVQGWKFDNSGQEPLKQQLIEPQEPQIQTQGFFEKIKNQFNDLLKPPDKEVEQRIIYLDGKVYPQNNMPNLVKNQKYNILSFVPMVLYQQFRYFFNLIFLFITLSQFVPLLKVGFLFSYVAPLAFVLILTLLKEAYDDFQRYKRDKEANSQEYTQIGKDKTTQLQSWQLKVGDIIEVHANQRIPADLILLHTNDVTGTVFIRTDQLDGETDWKLRKAIRHTQNYGLNKNLTTLNASITCEPPKLDIYDFKGLFKLEVGGGEGQREALSLENTLWCNTFLASGKIQAVVVYTGKECRSALNSREPRTKMGRLDNELNQLAKLLCVLLVCTAFTIVLSSGFQNEWLLQLFRHVLLLSSIIPISLRVNLDFSKLYFSYCISNDKDIDGSLARNSTIPEELGRISYVLTDKTGTLTQNTMIFKKLSLERMSFSVETLGLLKKMIKKHCTNSKYPMEDVLKKYQESGGRKIKAFKRNKDQIVRDLISALSLCHNVTPVEEDGQRTFQASSPDEIALVNFAEDVGFKLVNRQLQEINIINAGGTPESYKILYEFPFTSERKRMGIILQIQGQKGAIFYLKGADSVMKQKVPEVQRGFLMDECESLSREGLRTLVITQKYLTEDDLKNFTTEYEKAKNQMEDREARCSKVLDFYENDMELLGLTGVEDMLQEDIYATLESLKNAGIQIWMLTGDKVETAQCIAISTGLKSPTQEMFVIKDIEDSLILQNELNQFALKNNSVLVIDGQSLKVALEFQHTAFFHVACNAPAVVCCRCSPTQKAQVTELIKEHTQKTVLSIGDGGNDVAMIQAADVGVGIVGKEGKQAALASDFSILKFKHLAVLLLWHGRLAYKRTAVMAQFVMHRGLVIASIQTIFSIIFYFVAIPIYNGWLMLGYATVYTMFPVFCLIFDQDVTKEKALEYTELYKALLKGRELTVKTFLLWLFKSIYQAAVIMVYSFAVFQNTFLDLVTVTFSSLIVAELLNVFTEVNNFRLVMFLAELFTLGIYAGSIFFLQSYINLAEIDQKFIINVLILVLISWLPLHIVKLILRKWDPSESDKIMQKIRIRK